MKSLLWLKRVLAASVERNGEKPLTNAYLLNMVSMAIRAECAAVERAEKRLAEVIGEDKMWGSD